MDLSLTEEQLLLKDSVAGFVRDKYSVERRRQLRESSAGYDEAVWKEFAELGWLSLPFSEADGGIGGSAQDMMVVMEELGRGLVVEPYLVNIAICGGFLARASDGQRANYLPALMSGASQWAFAFAESSSRYNLAAVAVSALADGDDYLLSGEKIAVLNGASADYLVVSARTSGDSPQQQGISLFLVDARSEGIGCREYPLVDGSRGADISFSQVRVDSSALLGECDNGLAVMEEVVSAAIVAMGAEALGAVDALLEQTVEYTKTREQFGQAIGKFQALQHRMAEMFRQCQALRSLVYRAAIAQDEGSVDALKAASALKVKLGQVGRHVSQEAVQLHGGIGMTDELGISHYFKRLLLLNILFGDSEYHLTRYATL